MQYWLVITGGVVKNILSKVKSVNNTERRWGIAPIIKQYALYEK